MTPTPIGVLKLTRERVVDVHVGVVVLGKQAAGRDMPVFAALEARYRFRFSCASPPSGLLLLLLMM